MERMINECNCNQCGHKWESRVENPLECPQCKSRRWNVIQPNWVKAHADVQKAVKSGKLKKQACEWCGSKKNIQGHHEDYNKSLAVVWLCAFHHSRLQMKPMAGTAQFAEITKLKEFVKHRFEQMEEQ